VISGRKMLLKLFSGAGGFAVCVGNGAAQGLKLRTSMEMGLPRWTMPSLFALNVTL